MEKYRSQKASSELAFCASFRHLATWLSVPCLTEIVKFIGANLQEYYGFAVQYPVMLCLTCVTRMHFAKNSIMTLKVSQHWGSPSSSCGSLPNKHSYFTVISSATNRIIIPWHQQSINIDVHLQPAVAVCSTNIAYFTVVSFATNRIIIPWHQKSVNIDVHLQPAVAVCSTNIPILQWWVLPRTG